MKKLSCIILAFSSTMLTAMPSHKNKQISKKVHCASTLKNTTKLSLLAPETLAAIKQDKNILFQDLYTNALLENSAQAAEKIARTQAKRFYQREYKRAQNKFALNHLIKVALNELSDPDTEDNLSPMHTQYQGFFEATNDDSQIHNEVTLATLTMLIPELSKKIN